VVQQFPQQSQPLPVEIEAEPGAMPRLMAAFERWTRITVHAEQGSHVRRRVTVMLPEEPRAAAMQLLGFGDQLTVLSPPAVRAELARIGARLVEAYAVSPPRTRSASARR
jgi:predicted DNA-binding transcriptional regulator YafY